jgi:hypothetical protein
MPSPDDSVKEASVFEESGPAVVDPRFADNDDRFSKLVEEAQAIKARYIDPEYKWYRTHLHWPFAFFRGAGLITIVLGVTLPAIAGTPEAVLHAKSLILSVMSVAIAALTGLRSFYRWEHSWRGRVLVKLALEGLSAKWELEIARARLLVNPKDRLELVYSATNDLIADVRNVCSSETKEFFTGMQFPQSGHTAKQ